MPAPKTDTLTEMSVGYRQSFVDLMNGQPLAGGLIYSQANKKDSYFVQEDFFLGSQYLLQPNLNFYGMGIYSILVSINPVVSKSWAGVMLVPGIEFKANEQVFLSAELHLLAESGFGLMGTYRF